jgi:hypothetical protein
MMGGNAPVLKLYNMNRYKVYNKQCGGCKCRNKVGAHHSHSAVRISIYNVPLLYNENTSEFLVLVFGLGP